jgi:hypothetical protein
LKAFLAKHEKTAFVKSVETAVKDLKERLAVTLQPSDHTGVWTRRRPEYHIRKGDGLETYRPPKPRSMRGCAYDSKRRLGVLLGSTQHRGQGNDLWTYDAAKDLWVCLRDHTDKVPDDTWPTAHYRCSAAARTFWRPR